MRFEKIWIEQCQATRAIKRRFGAKSALDYLIGEKLLTFAKVARDHPEFAAELPKFLVAIYRVFNQFEIAGYVASRKPTAARRSDSFCSRPDTRLVAAISTDADTAQGSERGALALEMPLMSLVASARARRRFGHFCRPWKTAMIQGSLLACTAIKEVGDVAFPWP